ncbi:MAG TPA: hypothetical protein PLQ70_03785 [Flavobacterium alvei]|nr:hypothetical protein [Flavobacterium alvei]
MINKIHFIKYVAVLLFSLSLSAQQVSVTPQNVEYTNNGQPKSFVSGCGNIDLASSTSTLISMIVNIDTYTSVINNSESKLYIYTKKSFSDVKTQRYLKKIPSTNWTPGAAPTTLSYAPTVSFSINAADFNATGGTLLLVFESPSGTQYTSPCTFTITKTPPPSFSLSPDSLSLGCGEVTGRIFTITPANIPAGVTPSYSWSFPGWTEVGSTATSKNLQPSSGLVLPSTITVTQNINGVPTEVKTCTVSRSSIAPTGYISGSATVCTTRTFTFEGLLVGQSVTWNLSNATAGTLSTANGTSTTFTATAGGAVKLIATVTNSCGQSYVKELDLFAGLPPAFSLVRASNEFCDDIKYHYVPYEITNRNPAFTYTYNVTTYPWVKVTQTSQTYNGVTQDVLVFPKTYSGTIDIYVTTSNSCALLPFLLKKTRLVIAVV